MPQDWTDPPEDTDPLDVERPVGSADDLDPGGYDPGDDPASRAPEGSLAPPEEPDRGKVTYPVAPAAIPAWVKPLGNGKIPMDRMLKVAPLGSGYLVPEAAAAWRNLQNAASGAGFTLTMTGAYRSYDQQVELFNQRYSTSNTGGSSKVWNGTQYWLKPNMAMAAVPGTSNHGWGCAVDAALGGYGADAKVVDSAFLQWALEHASANGWSWEVQSEPWHLRLTGITAAPQARADAPAPPQASPTPTLKLGSVGGQVAALQLFCLKFAWGDCRTADGSFGPKTEAAVKAMQTALGATSDGVYGPQSAAALGKLPPALALNELGQSCRRWPRPTSVTRALRRSARVDRCAAALLLPREPVTPRRTSRRARRAPPGTPSRSWHADPPMPTSDAPPRRAARGPSNRRC